MKKAHLTFSVMLFVISVLLVFSFGCTTKKADKVPLTTTSKEALDLFLQGRDLSERLQGQEARQYFEQAVEKDPNFAMAWVYLAQTQPTNKGFFDTFAKAVALADQVSEGERLWIKGFEAGVNGFPMQQRELYKQLVDKYPDDERALNLMGIHYFGQQQWEEAVPYFRRCNLINPNFSTPYNQLGYAYRFLENYNEAEIAFKKYIELIPNDPNPYDSYAELLMKMGRFDESIEYYQKALEQNPHFAASFTGIALNLNLKGDFESARAQLQKLYDSARNTQEQRQALFAMGVSYVFEGDFDQAIAMQDKQYALNEQNNDATAMAGDLVTTGNILLEMGKADEAMAKYQQAVDLVDASDRAQEIKDNNHRQFLFNSARAALQKGDLETAKMKAAEYKTAVDKVKSPVLERLTHQLFGMIALKEKDYQAAVEELLLAPTDFNPQNYYRLGKAYLGIDDNEKAKYCFEKCAHFNGLDGYTYAFSRAKALTKLAEM